MWRPSARWMAWKTLASRGTNEKANNRKNRSGSQRTGTGRALFLPWAGTSGRPGRRRGAPWLSPSRRQQYIALYDFLRDTDLSLPEVALRFVLSNPDISCVLTGARSQVEVEENVAAAAKGPLPADIMQRLDEIAAMVPFRPLEEPFCLFSGRE